MPNWHEILYEISETGSTHDVTRRKYAQRLSKVTGRNIVLYYSGWLQKPNAKGCEVNDSDKNGLMTVVHKLDRSKGLDLILHTPGGETAARSEERRVGKECRSRWSPYPEKKKKYQK